LGFKEFNSVTHAYKVSKKWVLDVQNPTPPSNMKKKNGYSDVQNPTPPSSISTIYGLFYFITLLKE